MNEEMKNFIKLSKYFGCRFDVTQGAGGNTSAKSDDGSMLIKASGVYLSEISQNYGYARVDNLKISEIFKLNIETKSKKEKDEIASNLVNSANYTTKFRPSIETLLHSILKKYTLHSHPIALNAITCRKNCKKILENIFKDEDISFVEYKTPGFELASELKKVYNGEKIIFLKNHGLIVSSDSAKEVIDITEGILEKIEKFLKIDFTKYKLTTQIYNMLENLGLYDKTPYLCSDIFLNNNIKNKYIYSLPFCPDKMVYCGYKTLNLNCEDDIRQYQKAYFDIPKVVIYKDNLFFIANNTKKAKEAEDVLKSHLMSLILYKDNEIDFLKDEEIGYIGNWEAEKYRSNL